MDFNPFMETGNFVDLLNSQQSPILGSEGAEDPNFREDTQPTRKERRSWTVRDDLVLISAWLNTSKDPITGNEQRLDTFWNRVARYVSASPKLAGCEKREAKHCKNRWHKINELVCKFTGAYEAATREKRSGQNEDDVLKQAHLIYFTNHKHKFTLDHAWKELRNDQKWCQLSTVKIDGTSKRRKCGDGSQPGSSQVPSYDGVDDDGTTRPPGVKAAKARCKKQTAQGSNIGDLQEVWIMKNADSDRKERIVKLKLLDSLILKPQPLDDSEEVIKKKLMAELF